MIESLSSFAPVVSIVIPTAGRPELLKRAIQSCLTGKYASETEVIVVPNGPDQSWTAVEEELRQEPRVRFHYIQRGDQCLARNAGLELATGELVRFLDDDDYLFPEAASRQYAFALNECLDLCSAGVTLEDQESNHLGDLFQAATESVEEAVFGIARVQIPLAHVYRRTTLASSRWRVGMRQSEDIVWLIDYVAAAPRKWQRFEESVGVWYQHDLQRQSLDRPSGRVHEATAAALLEAKFQLQRQGRWTNSLAAIFAAALWNLVHRAFPFRPVYWHKIAELAQTIDLDARPIQPVYGYPLLKHLDPKLVMWALLPKRWVGLTAGNIKSLLTGRDYRRRL